MWVKSINHKGDNKHGLFPEMNSKRNKRFNIVIKPAPWNSKIVIVSK